MNKRKCVYTGQESNDKDSVIPRHLLKDSHNWASSVPTTTDYKNNKIDRLPTELEIQAAEVFYMLEISKLRVEFYESQLNKIQEEINKAYKPKETSVEKPLQNESKRSLKKKEKQIAIAEVDKEIQNIEKNLNAHLHEKMEERLTEMLNQNKGLWDE